jgi:hypothetical protein
MKKVTKKDLEKLIKEELSNVANEINEAGFDGLKTATVSRRLKQIVADLEELADNAEDEEISQGLSVALEMMQKISAHVAGKVVKRKVDPASIAKAKATRKANKTQSPEDLAKGQELLDIFGIV